MNDAGRMYVFEAALMAMCEQTVREHDTNSYQYLVQEVLDELLL